MDPNRNEAGVRPPHRDPVRRRVILLLLVAFWLVMMVQLWRSEFGAHGPAGSPVPVGVVWEKILTAPDQSALQITHRGTNVGFCRWTATVGQEISAVMLADDDLSPEGLVNQPTGYTLDLDGNVNLPDLGLRLAYDLNLKLGRDEAWQEFHGRMRLRPDEYQIDLRAADKTVRVTSRADGATSSRVFTFDELRNPQKLLREVGGPLLPALLASAGVPVSTNALSRLSVGVVWQAHQDWLLAGRTRMRVYRLETKLFDRYRIRVCVSPVGEILRVELPGDILLQHETLNSFPSAS
jgi:hypothetical protein